jgi:hypothetical protein
MDDPILFFSFRRHSGAANTFRIQVVPEFLGAYGPQRKVSILLIWPAV